MWSAADRALIVSTVREFVDRDVIPVASALEHRNEYPTALVERMKALDLFGINVPQAFGGSDLGAAIYAAIFEELARGWMSVAGVLGTHLVICDIIRHHGTEEQQARWLPRLATADWRGALALTEAHAGSDLQAIRTTATATCCRARSCGSPTRDRPTSSSCSRRRTRGPRRRAPG